MKQIFSKKKEKDTNINYVLLVIFAIAFIYAIVLLIKYSFDKPIVYNRGNIKQYITKENLVTSDYFYTLDSQVANFLQAVDKEMYFDLYQILLEKYNKIYSKNKLEKILQEYKNNVFIYENDSQKLDYTGHVINAYSIEDGKYLVQLDFNNGDFYLVLGNGLDKYNFTIVE